VGGTGAEERGEQCRDNLWHPVAKQQTQNRASAL
jgi:hypothetical protein